MLDEHFRRNTMSTEKAAESTEHNTGTGHKGDTKGFKGTLAGMVEELNIVPEEKSSTPPPVSSEVEAVAESVAEAPPAVLKESVAVQQPVTVEKPVAEETQKEAPTESISPPPAETELKLFDILSPEEERQRKRFTDLLDKTPRQIRELVSKQQQ